MDLAVGHVAAIKKLEDPEFSGWKPYNLGTGKGLSVLQILNAFRKASGKEIPHKIVERRAGDIATTFAECKLAEKELSWVAVKTVDEMCKLKLDVKLPMVNILLRSLLGIIVFIFN